MSTKKKSRESSKKCVRDGPFLKLEEENPFKRRMIQGENQTQTSQKKKNCRTQNFLRTPRIMSTLPLIDLFGQIRKEICAKSPFLPKNGTRGIFFSKRHK